MRNFIQPGNVIGVAAPDGGVSSGDGVQIGALFGVASTTQAAGETVELAVSGVYELAKESTVDAFAVGAELEWNAAASRVAALTTGRRIGVAVAPAGASAAVVRVRPDG